MESTKPWRRAAVALACAGLVAAACSGDSDRNPETAPVAAPPSAEAVALREAKEAARKQATDEALAIFKRSSDFLNAQKSLRFKAVQGFDAVQPWGQKLEFGGSRMVTLRRPDRLRVEVQDREGKEETLLFDGRQFAVDLPAEKAFVRVERPGSIDQLLDYLIEELGTPSPLADFIQSDFYENAVPLIRSGIVIGDSTIGEFACEHLAFRGKTADLQLWIEKGERPLPFRVVITYKNEPGSPQFRARFLNWELDPELSDDLFTFTPSEGAERLPVAALAAAAREQKEAP